MTFQDEMFNGFMWLLLFIALTVLGMIDDARYNELLQRLKTIDAGLEIINEKIRRGL